MKNLYNLNRSQLSELVQALGQKKFRAVQVWKWLYQKGATSIEEMTDSIAQLTEDIKVNNTTSLTCFSKTFKKKTFFFFNVFKKTFLKKRFSKKRFLKNVFKKRF